MESGPSFSWGFTQFQSDSNKIDISGFVPGDFDYKDVGFCENRSKYQNDPTIMKKLRLATSAKGKKPAVVISKRKRKEVVKKDPLPKVDKRFDEIEALMKKYYEEMMLAVKEYYDAPQKNDDGNTEFTRDHKGDEKLSTESSLKLNFDDPAIPKETIEVQNVQEESGTEVKNVAFQHFIDNTIAKIFSPVSAIYSDDLLQKENLADLILPQIIVKFEMNRSTEISSDAFQESMDNIIASMSTPVVAITLNLDDLSEKHADVIFYYLLKKSKQQKDQEYRYTTINCLFKTYIDATYKRYFEDAAGDSLSTQDNYKRSCLVASNEESLINIIKGFGVPAAFPWHMVDDVYVPVNYDENFHWVLAVISLKKRCIRVYDSMLSSDHRETSHEIHKLSVMLPTYLNDSEFLENTQRTV
ncbi:hypothetical protein FXO38_16166 [Capsicum annuum]|uniref:Ubiquitin-like protease family profile domain-containing protein n=1 Tax=Capsicum annuum TaxID=4072 RepID=A0A2G2Y1B3_CAPAN|nr:hypothetical protein FXO38_16166 [Capsicum annuum]PHT63528.1 hypothetical protein T459_32624 [Capsicum annuum]